MSHVLVVVLSYLCFNLGVWASTQTGSELAVALGYLLGCCLIGFRFRHDISVQFSQRPRYFAAFGGTAALLCTVTGMRYSHSQLPLSLSMEAVYNLLAISSWPLFLVLHRIWAASFQEKPNWFDLKCHLAMFGLILLRYLTYEGDYTLTLSTAGAIALAVAGYIGVNLAVMFIGPHRLSNIIMISTAGVALLLIQTSSGQAAQWQWRSWSIIGLALVAIASYGVPIGMSGAYAHFQKLGHRSLVMPLIYDLLLVVSPVLMYIRGEPVSLATWIVAVGMLGVTYARYLHHMVPRSR